MLKFLLLSAAVAVPAWSQVPDVARSVPPTITRYDDDWSKPVTDPEKGWTDTLRHIPLGSDAYMTTGLEVRARDETYTNPSFGDAPDDSYLWTRVMPSFDLHAGSFRAFVEPIVAYAAGMSPEAGPVDETGIDLLQGFVDIGLPVDDEVFTVRIGRQMLSLGSERLVGTRYGPNVPLGFDGVRLLTSVGPAKISLIAVKPVTPGRDNFDDETSDTKSLWGAYATVGGLDLYYLGFRNSRALYGGYGGRELRHGLGARVFGDRADWHWNIEGVAQFGKFATESINAWTLATEIGRRWMSSELEPDATVRLSVISGDRNATDSRLGTFNALFPKGKYFGELSPVGPYNIISLNPRVDIKLTNKISASLAGIAYWRYALGDGLYDVPGNLIRAPGSSRRRFIGTEAELTVSWRVTSEFELSGSLSAFAPGAFIEETGAADTTTLVGIESKFRF